MRGGGRFTAVLLALASAAGAMPARAQSAYPVVQSVAPGDVAVTVYRAPYRSSGTIDPDWPEGFAFISETRTIDLPAGTVVVRFEGVAEGLLPETAVVSGLPDGVIEKNRDARLLSPAGLVDAYLKRSVTLQRTDPATGKKRQQDAIIQAGPNGGVLLKTAAGYEAVGCSGLPERMTYGAVPKDLSAKPTLSVLVASDAPRTVSVQLLYLAEGFDWAANYVADRDSAAGTLGMTGWITLANGGVTGFPNAQLNVIAGRLEKQASMEPPAEDAGALVLQCWPMDITSTHPLWYLPPLIPVRGREDGFAGGEIVVRARRRAEFLQDTPLAVSAVSSEYLAVQEDLGDLKFYRLPFRTDVAAKQQKQVALVVKDAVRFAPLYTMLLDGGPADHIASAEIMMRIRNSAADGLGVALPAGSMAIFESAGGERLFVGESAIGDKAVDERIDLDLGDSTGLWVRSVERPALRKGMREWEVTLSNDGAEAADVELLMSYPLDPPPADWERRGAYWVWRVEVPANDRLVRSFRARSED